MGSVKRGIAYFLVFLIVSLPIVIAQDLSNFDSETGEALPEMNEDTESQYINYVSSNVGSSVPSAIDRNVLLHVSMPLLVPISLDKGDAEILAKNVKCDSVSVDQKERPRLIMGYSDNPFIVLKLKPHLKDYLKKKEVLEIKCKLHMNVKAEGIVFVNPEIETIKIEVPLKNNIMGDADVAANAKIKQINAQISGVEGKIKKKEKLINTFGTYCSVAKAFAEINSVIQTLKATLYVLIGTIDGIAGAACAAVAPTAAACYATLYTTLRSPYGLLLCDLPNKMGYYLEKLIWPVGAIPWDVVYFIGMTSKISCLVMFECVLADWSTFLDLAAKGITYAGTSGETMNYQGLITDKVEQGGALSGIRNVFEGFTGTDNAMDQGSKDAGTQTNEAEPQVDGVEDTAETAATADDETPTPATEAPATDGNGAPSETGGGGEATVAAAAPETAPEAPPAEAPPAETPPAAPAETAAPEQTSSADGAAPQPEPHATDQAPPAAEAAATDGEGAGDEAAPEAPAADGGSGDGEEDIEGLEALQDGGPKKTEKEKPGLIAAYRKDDRSKWQADGKLTTVSDVMGGNVQGMLGLNLQTGLFDPYTSIHYAERIWCVPAIAYNYKKDRQVKCMYRNCVRDNLKAGLPTSSCDVAYAQRECLYVEGAEYKKYGYKKIFENLDTALIQFIISLIKNTAVSVLCKKYNMEAYSGGAGCSKSISSFSASPVAVFKGALYSVTCGTLQAGLAFKEVKTMLGGKYSFNKYKQDLGGVDYCSQ